MKTVYVKTFNFTLKNLFTMAKYLKIWVDVTNINGNVVQKTYSFGQLNTFNFLDEEGLLKIIQADNPNSRVRIVDKKFGYGFFMGWIGKI